MQVLNAGECILLRNLVFEDEKVDIKKGHPGIVIIPTDENDEVAYCIHMTSDKRVYEKDIDKFYVCDNFLKKSYINLRHIIKTQNCYRAILREMDEEEYIEILSELYNYQIEHEETDEFKEIKEDIEIVLELYKARKENNEIELTVDTIKMLRSVPKEYRKAILYAKYRWKIPSKDVRYGMKLVNVKERLGNYIERYETGNYDKAKQLYSDLKIFYGNNIEQLLKLAFLMLKSENNNKEYLGLLDMIENDMNKAIEETKIEKAIRLEGRYERLRNKKAQERAKRVKRIASISEKKICRINMENSICD